MKSLRLSLCILLCMGPAARAADNRVSFQNGGDTSFAFEGELKLGGITWQAKRATNSFGSPIVHNVRMAFFVNQEGGLYGPDAATGEEAFAKGLEGSTWATPLGVGNSVLFCGCGGKIDVDVLSDLQGSRSISTWDGLPEPEDAPAEGGPRGPMSSGPVLYAAIWCGSNVLLRQGDRLCAVVVACRPSEVVPHDDWYQ